MQCSLQEALHAIPVQLFSKHVMDLHMNQEVGFAKEYEEIRAASCLEEFAAQESQNPDNVERNRYPNIVACKWGQSIIMTTAVCMSVCMTMWRGTDIRILLPVSGDYL